MAKNPNQIKWSDIGGVFVGTAYIFGDQTGDARGDEAIDVQASRLAATQVASGQESTALGQENTASGTRSVAVGYSNSAASNAVAVGSANTASGSASFSLGVSNTASGNYTSCVGSGNTASGYKSSVFGYACLAGADNSLALGLGSQATAIASTASGYYAKSRIANTTNICGPQINRKDNGESAGTNFSAFCGVSVRLFTNEVDLKAAASQTITIPTGAHFFPDECGVTVTSATGVIVQPSIRFGNSGNHAALLAITAGSALSAAFARNRFQTLLTSAGQQDLVAEVTTGATATTLLGRFYFAGLLVEDE